MHTVYLSLGTNLGRRRSNISRATTLIREQIGTIVRQSALYETEPWGFSSKKKFINAAICVMTELTPHQLLSATQAIERELGRTHKTKKPPTAPLISTASSTLTFCSTTTRPSTSPT